MQICHDNRGFSLLEVLIAMVILSVGLLGVAGMQTMAISGNYFAQSGTEAIQLGEEMIDRIRTNAKTNPQRYDGIVTSSGCVGLLAPAAADCQQWATALENSTLLNPRGRVTVTTDSPMTNTSTISVILTWGNGSGRSMTFTTILETWGT